ncbi:MAG: hypothetical protein II623_04135 [Paludibacteraceae bacterium]|nr:hypothetical protein [Paludibacteraceae bacterium]MBR6041758.1 hypothetical protein [Paludibacteraceae bacterium]
MLRIAKHFCLLFFLLFGVAAKAQVKISASIDSPSIMMGQQTVVHFHVSQPQHLAVQLPVLSDILAPGVYIVSVSGDTIADGSTISINDNIVITVFEPGDYVIPPFVCREQNKEYKTSELKLKVSDVPDVFVEGKLPADIKEINTPPYSTTLWVVLIVSVVLMVLMGIWTYYYWRKHREDPEPYVKNSAVADSAQPEKTALELIRNLAAEKCWQTAGNEKTYFTLLTDVLRQYFYRRYSIMALEMTSSELIDALKKTNMPIKLREEVREICFTGDMTKFAKHKPTDGECVHCAELAEQIVLKTMLVEKPKEGGNAKGAAADAAKADANVKNV